MVAKTAFAPASALTWDNNQIYLCFYPYSCTCLKTASVVFNAARERDVCSNSISTESMQSAVFNTGIENECVKRLSSLWGCRLHPFARANLNTFTRQRVFLQFWFKTVIRRGGARNLRVFPCQLCSC